MRLELPFLKKKKPTENQTKLVKGFDFKSIPLTQRAIVDEIIRKEGGYVNHPSDIGGPTKYGVTQNTLSQWRFNKATVEDVKHLTIDEARAIYYHLYIKKPKFDKLTHPTLLPFLVDYAVHSGPSRSIKALQTTLNAFLGIHLQTDGKLGPNTLGAVKSIKGLDQADQVLSRLVDERILFFISIVKSRPNQLVFLEGWVKRTLSFRR